MHEEKLKEHRNRLAELQQMVEEIAQDIGLDSTEVLQFEVRALGKRLDDIKDSIRTLADVAEARVKNEQESQLHLQDSKKELENMQQQQVIS